MDSKITFFFIVIICWKRSICSSACCSNEKSAIYCKKPDSLPKINISKPNIMKRLEVEGINGQVAPLKESLDKYTKLKVVNFKNNMIEEINSDFFQNNPDLEEINLEYNEIKTIPPTLFNCTLKLKILWLNNNRLQKFSKIVFENNPELKALFINNNKIQYLQLEFFRKISKLEILDVRSNELSFFNPEFFTVIRLLEFFYTSGFSDCCNAKKRITRVKCTYKRPEGTSLERECGIRIVPNVKDPEDKFIGRVEINDKGTWKTMSDTEWTKHDADTVCRELGYNDSVEPLLPEHVDDGEGPSWTNNLDCKGREFSTLQCKHKNQTGNPHDKDVGVRCQYKNEELCKACTSTNGTFDCSNKELKRVPWVKKNCYVGNTITYLLSQNNIKWIYVDILRRFSKLEILDLSSNIIEKIPETLFVNLTALKNINFAGNKIRTIPVKLLHNLRELKILDLSSNSLVTLEENVFSGSKLETLILKGNSFKLLHASYFSGLSSLRVLDVSKMDISAGTVDWNSVMLQLPQLEELSIDYFSHCCFVVLERSGVICNPRSDTFSSCAKMLKSDVLRYLMWVLVVLTFGGNLFSLLMRLTEKDDNKVQNMLVCSLCVSDMLMGVYLAGIINKEISTRGVYYQFDREWRSGIQCRVFGAISVISSEVSVFTLVVIAYDRFLHVVRALDFKEIKFPIAVILLLTIWITCIVIAVIPMVVKTYFQNKVKSAGFYGTSSICLPLQLPSESATAWEYCFAIFGVLNFVAAVYLIVVYIRIFYSSYKSAHKSGNTARMNDHPKMATRFAGIVFTDVCCWVPIAMLLFLSLVRAVSDENNELYAWFSICVIPINSAINPILYTLGTPFFWKKLKSHLKKFLCFCKRGENDSQSNLQLQKHDENQEVVT